jgi:PAS domain S-box-containing protein
MPKQAPLLDPKRLGIVALLAIVYLVAARIGLRFAIVHSNITALWPPSGIAVAAIFLLGRWTWPGVFLGACLANYTIATPLLPSLTIGFGNTLAALVGAEILRRLPDFRADFSRIKDVLLFTLCAGAFDPAVAASLGVTSLWSTGLLPAAGVPSAWWAWWAGDAVGVLTVAPLLFALYLRPRRLPPAAALAEGALMLGCFLLFGYYVLWANEAFRFLVYPLSVWAAIRARHLGVCTLGLTLVCFSLPLLILKAAPEAHFTQEALLAILGEMQLFLVTSNLTGMLLAADITSRSRAESELADREERLRVILSNSPDIIVAQDTNLRYTFVANPQLGFAAKDVIGRTDDELLAPKEVEFLKRIKQRVLSTGESAHLEMPLKAKDGTTEHFEGSWVPKRDARGTINGLIGYFRNITERKQAQETHSAYVESERVNRAKDQFIATLSHELRTPLTAILAWVQMIKSGQLDATAERMGILAIEDCALTQNQLINDLLDVSRIVTGKLVLKPSRVSVTDVLRAAVDTVRPSAEKRRIAITETYASSAPVTLADPVRLKQIFWNLLSNAVKFTPEEGKISVDLDTAGGKIRVRVSDTGTGLAPEAIPFLFRRFSQVDSSLTRGQGGLGLGLSLARSLLELQNGSIEASSPGLGHGSTFTVLLPTEDGAAEALPSTTAQPDLGTALGPLKILFVDDDLRTREAIAMTLERAGAEVRVAGSASEAMNALKSFEPDLILSDIAMPREDGLSLVRRIRASGRTHIPAIAFSAIAGPDVAKAIQEAGFQAHLLKPLEFGELVRTIREIRG